MKNTKVLHRSLNLVPRTAVKGEGIYLIDENGKKYLNGCSGAAVSCLGHSHPKVIEAIKKQIDAFSFAHTSFFTSKPAEELAELLIEETNNDFESVYYVSSGSEAVESALKLARQYVYETGQQSKKYFISRKQSYHGNTLGALSVGGHMERRAVFEDILMKTHNVSPCYAYRQQGDLTEEEYARKLADELDDKIKEVGAENIIGFCAETVVGATTGATTGVKNYFKYIREVCDKHKILLILDEVMSGVGRTGTFTAYEQENIKPDIMTIAKGLGAGYQMIGAVMGSKKVMEAIYKGSNIFKNSHTYTGHPTSCAASLAVQKVIKEENLLENVNKQSTNLFNSLNDKLKNNPYVGDIRGRGLLLAIEYVTDKGTKETFKPSQQISNKIYANGMENGVMLYPCVGTADGINGDHTVIAPPFIMTNEQTEELATKIEKTILDTFKGI